MNKVDDCSDLEDHIILCGFSNKVGVLLEEFSTDPNYEERNIVLVSQLATPENLQKLDGPIEKLLIMAEDYTSVDVLRRTGVSSAKVAIILAETSEGRSTHDVDARTILAALTIEKLETNVHTCAEIFHEEYTDHLRMDGVNDIIIRNRISGRLMANVGLNRGLMSFYEDILTRKDGNVLDFMSIPDDFAGKRFEELLSSFSVSGMGIALGLKKKTGS